MLDKKYFVDESAPEAIEALLNLIDYSFEYQQNPKNITPEEYKIQMKILQEKVDETNDKIERERQAWLSN